MPKTSIYRVISLDGRTTCWRVLYYKPTANGMTAYSEDFLFPDGAFIFWLQIERQNVRELSAWAKLYKLNMRLLTLRETEFIKKLLKNKCFGITKRQYGYLSGIYERQVKQ